MTVANAIFQGIIQGLTEFIPVSSSGHLSLIQYFTGQGAEYGLFFTVLLHVGTLLAVVLAFWKIISELIAEFFHMLADIARGKFSFRQLNPQRRMILMLILSLFPLVITLYLRDWFTYLATDESLFAEGISFLITSAFLFLSGRCIKGHKGPAEMTKFDALAIGTVQAFAPLPGLSRSGSTISMGLILGLERKHAAAFSFIMSIPAVMGASVLELGDALREGVTTIPVSAMVAGTLASLVVGLLAIRLVRYMVLNDKFALFGWYTLVLGIIVLVAATVEHFTGGILRQTVMALVAA